MRVLDVSRSGAVCDVYVAASLKCVIAPAICVETE